MLSFKKSSEPDFSNETIVYKLNLLLKEQHHQRLDLSVINALLKTSYADKGVQKQVDDFYAEDGSEVIPEEEK